MAKKKNPDSWWQRINYKYRLSLMNEDTLVEAWHIKASRLGAFTLFTISFFVILFGLAVLIIYTPLRNLLPGYSDSIRHQLVEKTIAVDSLSAEVTLQAQCIDIVKQVLQGEVKADTILPLDSLQILARTRLLEAKAEATEEFIAQYEAKEKDNLHLFSVQQTVPTITFFKPVQGVVVTPYEQTKRGVEIRTSKPYINSVLAGTVVFVTYEINNTYTLVLQHDEYMTVYRNVSKVLQPVGSHVDAGASVALASSTLPLSFELWYNGDNINPEEVIAF